MNPQEAKAILLLYRPGTADVEDPSFAEALELCECDPELKQWFENHCSVYLALRSKFKATPVPGGLKEQILAERKVHVPSFRFCPSLVAVAATLILLVGVASVWLLTHSSRTFSIFHDRMVSKAFRTYSMDVITDDPEKVRAYLVERQAPSDYVLPSGLAATRLVGCVATQWRGFPVAMICFSSAPDSGDVKTDLWLFVVRNQAISGAPAGTEPRMRHVDGVVTASWTRGPQTYVLVMEGDERAIRSFL